MKNKKLIKILIIILVALVGITFIINTIIANSVISSMSDVTVIKNEHTLEEYNLEGYQISVKTKDNLNINTYVSVNNNSKGNVIIIHGMHGMDATSLFDYAKFIFDAGFTPIVVDLRAHGKSEGDKISFGYKEVNDVLAVIDYIKEDDTLKNAPIFLYGLSMGGSTAINVASKSSDISGVIAVSPFLSYQKQVEDYMLSSGAPKAFVGIFMPSVNLVLTLKFKVNPYDERPIESIKNIGNTPILIIHGDKDTQTKYYHSEELYDSASSENKELWIVKDKDHLIVEDVLDSSSNFYTTKIIDFLESVNNATNN